MSEHYYTGKPTAKHEQRTIQDKLRGRAFTFLTDAGVFSKGGVDFGSRLLIETMEVRENDRVLDVGCGYGPIGLTAATLALHGAVTMVDINERAVELAKSNAQKNGIANVSIITSDLFEAVQEQEFDCILTNPPIRAGKETVHRIFEEAYQHLALGGSLWVVIQKKQGAPSAFTKLEALFGEVQEAAKDKGYWIFRCVKSD
ncbi:class I SAM-dependent methyltransferase [Gorillibacterium massiliense]|uniref:class I SAM-dependent methyltransferase n=1 Tax=Gorillibacterium massiliense TaxID=1280390 RepID=UPI0004B5066D|nr:class I SAM-dependent methyltransferase [Gorillibacterium massiliense]